MTIDEYNTLLWFIVAKKNLKKKIVSEKDRVELVWEEFEPEERSIITAASLAA